MKYLVCEPNSDEIDPTYFSETHQPLSDVARTASKVLNEKLSFPKTGHCSLAPSESQIGEKNSQ
jgi:hypothetical protein